MADSTDIVPVGDIELATVGNWQVEEFWDNQDFGNKPDYSAEDMQGRCIIVRGISEAEFESPKYKGNKARSILHNWPEEKPTSHPWGVFFSTTSVPIKKLSEVQRFPVAVRLWRRQGADYVYWDMERYIPQFDDKGNQLPPNDDKVVQNFLQEKKAVLD